MTAFEQMISMMSKIRKQIMSYMKQIDTLNLNSSKLAYIQSENYSKQIFMQLSSLKFRKEGNGEINDMLACSMIEQLCLMYKYGALMVYADHLKRENSKLHSRKNLRKNHVNKYKPD